MGWTLLGWAGERSGKRTLVGVVRLKGLQLVAATDEVYGARYNGKAECEPDGLLYEFHL